MSGYISSIEYKFKVTNNLDKPNAQQKKFNFYVGLPYSQRKYRYMQITNFATDNEGHHLFAVVLGHTESCVAAMTEDLNTLVIASNNCTGFITTKMMRICYTSINVGQAGLICNAANDWIFSSGDWTGISGEYTDVMKIRTNENSDTIALIFDTDTRSAVSARKNDNTNVVAKPDIVKVSQPEDPVIDIDPSEYARCLAENWRLKDIETRYDRLFKGFGDKDCENHTLKEQIKVATMLAEKWKQQYIELGVRVMLDKFRNMDDDLLCKEIRELVERYKP